MSGFQKILVIVLVFGVGAFFAAEWKIERDARRAFDKLRPWASVNFDRASLKLSGEISISGVVIRPNMADMSFSIAEVAWSYGNVLQTLFGTYDLEPGKIPEKISLSVKGFELPMQRIAGINPEETAPNPLDVIAASACGTHQRLGIEEMVAMGYDINMLSFSLTVQNNPGSVATSVSGFFEIENMTHVAYDSMVDTRLAGRVNSLEQPLEALQSLELTVNDIGYNQVKTIYCAREAGTSNAEYATQHVQKAAALLQSVEITPTADLLSAYENYQKPGSTLQLKIRPEANVRFSDLAFYDFDSIKNMLRLEVAVNGKEVSSFFENWHTDRFKQIAQLHSELPNSSKPKPVTVDRARIGVVEEKPPQTPAKSFRSTPVAEAHNYLEAQVFVVRDNGKNYTGTLVRAQEDKIWINVSQVGEAVIPVAVSSITEFQVLRE